MKGLYHGLVVRVLFVDRYVEQVAGHLGQQFKSYRNGRVLDGTGSDLFLKSWIPGLHQLVYLRHLLLVENGRSHFFGLYVFDTFDPRLDLLGVLMCCLQGKDLLLIFIVVLLKDLFDQQVQIAFLFHIETRFVESKDAQSFAHLVRSWWFQESIDFANSWDVLGYEWLQF